MPQMLVLSDLTASRVGAVAAVFETLRDGDADARPPNTTACPPRQACGRVHEREPSDPPRRPRGRPLGRETTSSRQSVRDRRA